MNLDSGFRVQNYRERIDLSEQRKLISSQCPCRFRQRRIRKGYKNDISEEEAPNWARVPVSASLLLLSGVPPWSLPQKIPQFHQGYLSPDHYHPGPSNTSFWKLSPYISSRKRVQPSFFFSFHTIYFCTRT